MKQKAITISLIKNNSIEDNAGEQRMTSLEIAELTGKQHKDVLKAVRNMEPAWTNVTGRKFALSEYQYIATKFNDEARARLVLRWQELEMDQREALEWERWKARWSQIERPKGAIALLGCSEEDILDEADDIIGEELDELNQRSDDCYTPTEIGKPFGLDARDLNSFLCDQGIIQWAKGQWMPTRKFMNQGLTENRSFVIHGRNGHRRTVSRLVWTAKGRDFIMNIIKH